MEVIDIGAYFARWRPGRHGPNERPTLCQRASMTYGFVLSVPKFRRSTRWPNRTRHIATSEMVAAEWAEDIDAVPVSFELLPLGKDDLMVHEWGVFTVLNDSKFANADRKEEWATFPSFFYRQFPTVRLPWFPSAWDKPIIYVYAKPNPIHMNLKVRFAEGVPVVWWPATSDPIDTGSGRSTPNNKQPFRWLTWMCGWETRRPSSNRPG